jgi:hypothetical protein
MGRRDGSGCLHRVIGLDFSCALVQRTKTDNLDLFAWAEDALNLSSMWTTINLVIISFIVVMIAPYIPQKLGVVV